MGVKSLPCGTVRVNGAFQEGPPPVCAGSEDHHRQVQQEVSGLRPHAKESVQSSISVKHEGSTHEHILQHAPINVDAVAVSKTSGTTQ